MSQPLTELNTIRLGFFGGGGRGFVLFYQPSSSLLQAESPLTVDKPKMGYIGRVTSQSSM